jgi:hypothetical protein
LVTGYLLSESSINYSTDYCYPTSTEDGLKSSGHIIDAFRDPKTLSSQDPLTAPFNRAFDVPLHFFEWCELSGNERRLRRFSAAMKGSTTLRTPDAGLAGEFLPFSTGMNVHHI